MISFKELLELVANNKQDVTHISSTDTSDAPTDSSVGLGRKKFSAKQLEELALVMPGNTNITSVYTGHYIYDVPDELVPFLEIINSYEVRNSVNKKIANTKLSNYLLANLSNFIMTPVVLMAELGKSAFSKTLGLEFLWKYTRAIGSGRFEWKLPTIAFSLQPGSFVYRQLTGDYSSYPVISLGSNVYSGSYLSAPLAIVNYIFRNLGKLIGILLTIPFMPIVALAAGVKSVINRISDKFAQERELAKAEENIQFTLISLAADAKNNFWLGEFYRNAQNFALSFKAFADVPQSDERFIDAMYEAAEIALHRLNDTPAAIKLIKQGLAVARDRKDQSMIEQFEEMLRLTSVKPEEIIFTEEKSFQTSNEVASQYSPTLSWRETKAATNYGELRERVIDSQNQLVSTDEITPTSQTGISN